MMIWADPKSERQTQILHELSARVLVETDPQTLNDLTEQLILIAVAQLRARQAN